MLQILIADDHAVARQGLKHILLDTFTTAEIGEAADAEELIKKVMTAKWDVVITDLSMPGRSGFDALQQIKLSFPNLPVLILSIYPEAQYALRAIKAGASGYLSKDCATEELTKAVQNLLLGKKYISPAIAEIFANTFSADANLLPHEKLSDREFNVFKHLATGKTITEIAAILSLSTTTISTYRTRLLHKMDLKFNTDLTAYALDNKLI